VKVEDKIDYKHYEWKAARNKDDMIAKVRLTKDDAAQTFEAAKKARDTYDDRDPNWMAANKQRQVYERVKEADEISRQYFGVTLTNELKVMKGIMKKNKTWKKGGDE